MRVGFAEKNNACYKWLRICADFLIALNERTVHKFKILNFRLSHEFNELHICTSRNKEGSVEKNRPCCCRWVVWAKKN